MNSIYGNYENSLEKIKTDLENRFVLYQEKQVNETGEKIYEHLSVRIKTDESMREKCRRKGVPETLESALVTMKDAIGIRVVCSFKE